jgi:tricorn protease
MKTQCLLFVGLLMAFSPMYALADSPIRLATSPDISPNGKQLAFAWRGDIWISSGGGGVARQLTSFPADESDPKFSPDGSAVAFVSRRTGSAQVYVVPVRGGVPKQLTHHTEGYLLEQWPSDGELLVRGNRDHFWRRPERLLLLNSEERSPEQLVFDGYGKHGRISPDGTRVLFTREGVRGWRKGYEGSQASQIWSYEVKTKKFRKVCEQPTGARSPLWAGDNEHFYYIGGQSGSFNLYRRNVQSGKETQLTNFKDDSVVMPTVSTEGNAIVFRHLFDFYRLDVKSGKQPRKLKLIHRGDQFEAAEVNRVLTSASDVSFSKDGLEIAFIAGGDLWVMDTVLREPKQITSSPEEESDPVFAPEGGAVLFCSDAGGQSDIWKATRGNEKKFWWQNEEFTLAKITDNVEREYDLSWSPSGDRLAFVSGRGDLWVMKNDGTERKRFLQSWNRPDYDWSPDGKWLTYAMSDNEFNRDIYIAPLDGSKPPTNISRHPDNDNDPVWSPDGKMIAFTGRRVGTETDIYFVQLQKSDHETDSRDRKIKEAIEKIQKARKAKAAAEKAAASKAAEAKAKEKPEETKAKEPTTKVEADKPEKASDEKEKPAAKPTPKKKLTEIDFDGLEERIQRISIGDTSEGGLFWSHDSKKLAFTASIAGKHGTYTVSPPASLSAKLLTTTTGSHAKWISAGNQIVWLVSGKPATLNSQAASTSYSFSANQSVDVAAKNEALFDICWRAMRDNWYDGKLNNRNWSAVRRKYLPAAREAVDATTLSTIVNMMLGELNGSHLGFSMSRSSSSVAWKKTTAHLGARFDMAFRGPGLKIKDVLKNSPAWKVESKLNAGEVIMTIDGKAVDAAMDLTEVLNGVEKRDVHLEVKNAKGEMRSVTIRPTSFSSIRKQLYEKWIDDNQRAVKKLSKGRMGYVHIQGMNMPSFYRFERELYSAAAGKDGLVIDVRENGGGFTTDHLLTVLTQPVHAITVPRGGGPGYPQDRKIYAAWNKPIVVLCNQNSFSNAEIFSHAIKQLGRGQLVGVTTAGGVISTGGMRVMDVGFLRMPFRGWFLLDGKDMELNGAVPHHVLWPKPGQLPAGTDVQLNKAVQVLAGDIKKWKAIKQPDLIKASELRK